MKKGTIYSLMVGFAALLSSCAGTMQTYDLNEEYAASLHYEEMSAGQSKGEAIEEKSEMVGVPALNFYGGDLKRGAIWWVGKGIFLEKGEIFTFDTENVGPDSIPFGATFPPLDLIKAKMMLKISARAEGVNGDEPVVYLQVDDASGYKADAKRPFQKIENSEAFKDYYFDLRDIYVQSVPKHSVNGAMINSVKFFINPGQKGFTGKIYIREIKLVPAPEGK